MAVLSIHHSEDPIRGEVYSGQRLEDFAMSLAQEQASRTALMKGKSLKPRIRENRKILEDSFTEIEHDIDEHRAIPPAAEWLVDNFHLVRGHLKDIHDHLPTGYYQELPKITSGPFAGLPRIYEIIWMFVAHTDSRLDEDVLFRYLKAYQSQIPLKMGELWALSSTLSIVYIENLRRIGSRIVLSQKAKSDADALADEILGLGEKTPRSHEDIVIGLEKQEHPVALIVYLLQRLRFQEARVDPILQWIEQTLSRQNLQIDSLITEEHIRQAAANATARNIITSFRFVAAFNWQDFFEKISLVDLTLRQNPMYGNMDFATRDRYRHRIEKLAKRCDSSEWDLAKKVIQITSATYIDNMEEVFHDPGYYLIGKGKIAFEKVIHYRKPLFEKLAGRYKDDAIFSYPVGNIAVTVLITLWLLSHMGAISQKWWPFVGAIIYLVWSEIQLVISNRITVAFLGPQHLPRHNLEGGLPDDCRTFIVVPTMLTDEEGIEAQVEELEIHYLTNPHGNEHLALLTDWVDSTSEHRAEDAALLTKAKELIQQLNVRHGPASNGKPRFYLFHRVRKYNAKERAWMGWERKRGKLHEFNLLLLKKAQTTFLLTDEEREQIPEDIRFVITLDADTKLPRGAVAQLVGTLAHPLNRARYNEKKGRVTEGYGILQPRVTSALPATEETSWFQKLTSGPCGVDPYSSAVSDVYQDLFGEGSFAGKGIYDLKIFEKALEHRVPENALLSHDLFEGNFARCGFLNDVEVFEDFPSHVLVAAGRNHRWIRGDWQLLPWIFGPAGRQMSFMGRWKMLDNLRRSVFPIVLFILFVMALSGSFQPAWILLAVSFLGLTCHELMDMLGGFFTHKPMRFRDRIGILYEDLVFASQKWLLQLILLPTSAWFSVDAIARTLYRLFYSHEKLLEWVTAAQAKASAVLDVKNFIYRMRGGWVLTFLSMIVISFGGAPNPLLAGIICLLWIFAPVVAYRASSPPRLRLARPLHEAENELLRQTARKIWHFFANVVTAEDSFLPPDNFQEDPEPILAHRSSPTNFGLYLLSGLAAKDFGWIGLRELVDRWQKTLGSMEALPKFEGHFLNWYETTTMRALEPRYVSSVDNGNLAGHLIVVAQACEEMLAEKIHFRAFREGLNDTLIAVRKTLPVKDAALDIPVRRKFKDLQNYVQGHPQSDVAFWRELPRLSTLFYEEVHRQHQGQKNPASQRIFSWSRELHEGILTAARDFHDFLSFREYRQQVLPQELNHAGTLRWQYLQSRLGDEMSLGELPSYCEELLQEFEDFETAFAIASDSANGRVIAAIKEVLENSRVHAVVTIQKVRQTSEACQRLFLDMDFGLLYDSSRKLFSIGLRVAENVLDPSYYDLMASEARLLSFVAIAKGDVPVAHWFSLGRGLTRVGRGASLVSWSGSMFEYLMPSLVLRTPESSMIKQTCELSVKKQIEYGDEKSIPWGISESAYHKRDLHQTYQYSNFGVPDLALKRGVENDLVVAPYASLLAAMYDPVRAAENLERLQQMGVEGDFGFYEAVDFTSERLRAHQSYQVIRCYMAHHQGMSLVSLANVFFDGVMIRRFHSEPIVQATELLLQERTPRALGSLREAPKKIKAPLVQEEVEHVSRQYHRVHRATPPTQLLSNGEYTVMLTIAGSGFSRYKEQAVTRWREDVTQDNWGQYLFIKDLKNQNVWSATYQPLTTEPQRYEVVLAEDRVRYQREDFEILTELEVFVSPESQIEIRRLLLTNTSEEERTLEVTSYMESVINAIGADSAHPAFSNLFIQTEFLKQQKTLIASRRPRSSTDTPLWMGHGVALDAFATGEIEYETDRFLFLGRGRNIKNAEALFVRTKLHNSLGAVLDPVLSLRTQVQIPPGAKTALTFYTMVAPARKDLELLAENMQDSASYERLSSLAWTQAQIKLHFLNLDPDEAHLFQRLATRLIFSDASLRPASRVLTSNTRDLAGLWSMGISGDHPIMLVRIDDHDEMGLVRQLLKAQDFFAHKNFKVDLVVVNTQGVSYSQELQNTLEGLRHSVFTSPARGQLFVLQASQLSQEERVQLYSEARVLFSGKMGSLSEQLGRTLYVTPADRHIARNAHSDTRPQNLEKAVLSYFNGLGGFTEDGREYVIDLNPTHPHTPAPWINVISNGEFGFHVSELGSGYTWSQNSRENQLTPWSNDPVSDPSGEALYIYDRDSGQLWSPVPYPIYLPGGSYRTRHGQGYTQFEHMSHSMRCRLTQFAAKELPVKVSQLILENTSRTERNISIYAYVEWVLGFLRSTMAPTTVTEWDEEAQILLATNVRNSEFGTRVAFAGFLIENQHYTGDRREFIGRNRSLANPFGIFGKERLSRSVGAGYDPCGAFQTDVQIPALGRVEVTFVLGQAESREKVREHLKELRAHKTEELLSEVQETWNHFLTQVQVETPDPSFDLMINRWLLYQTMSCRFWARSAFYQAGGAYGFRDQLQDSLALLWAAPKVARQHIIRAASRQFVEGDVQHWWHPPSGRGVRTHFSDDLLWLPYVVSAYISVTQDESILDERVSFLEGPLLREDQEDSYYTPHVSVSAATVFEHCARALDRSLKTGAHSLPLMGCGDWNDGMNRIGKEGKGESVWLGWFLISNLQSFAEIASRRNEAERVQRWLAHIEKLKAALDSEAWDGSWYRRAFYDDGTPVGSSQSDECKIDSIAQSWSVISGAADPERARLAMKSLDEILVQEADKLLLLFKPPFDQTEHDPGYIKGYLPGVRENGGQYTHAATWTVIAHVLLGNGNRAMELFNMLNPIHHGKTLQDVQKYKIEPYVLAGDVYSQSPHNGRGGWSWYTGASGWLYRAGVEYILGLRIRGNQLDLKPCVPSEWNEFKLRYRFGSTTYEIHVLNPRQEQSGSESVILNGQSASFPIAMVDDGKHHKIEVTMGPAKDHFVEKMSLK
ncbi:GH36-type glycosyl hydrolase domain-containing protein [Bdellovibrio sp. HCB2-146]|uniref:GH36-type glycosyl hydrolase domain-containing protein n=1 Tax=Bdellovibrio sp. HCB2-146 TaxID=3394362 RepID=UPI0039BC6185